MKSGKLVQTLVESQGYYAKVKRPGMQALALRKRMEKDFRVASTLTGPFRVVFCRF